MQPPNPALADTVELGCFLHENVEMAKALTRHHRWSFTPGMVVWRFNPTEITDHVLKMLDINVSTPNNFSGRDTSRFVQGVVAHDSPSPLEGWSLDLSAPANWGHLIKLLAEQGVDPGPVIKEFFDEGVYIFGWALARELLNSWLDLES